MGRIARRGPGDVGAPLWAGHTRGIGAGSGGRFRRTPRTLGRWGSQRTLFWPGAYLAAHAHSLIASEWQLVDEKDPLSESGIGLKGLCYQVRAIDGNTAI